MSTSRSHQPDELVRQARREMLELVRTMQTGLCDPPEVETLIVQLAQGLENGAWQEKHGYLPKPIESACRPNCGSDGAHPAWRSAMKNG
jgi:hypothetical protein